MTRRFPVSLVLGVCLLVLPAVAIPAAAAGPTSASPAAASADLARHDAVVAHWTAARLRSAVSRDFVLNRSNQNWSTVRQFTRPLKKPPQPGGGGTVTGASWTKGGLILTATGKVYFEMGGIAYVCSGSVARDNRSGYSLVLTAGHCAYDESNGAFAVNWLFIPDFDGAPTFTCAQTVFGCWTAQGLVVHRGYATAGGFNTQATTYDFAFAVVGGGGKNGTTNLETAVGGSFPLAFNSFSVGTAMDAFGYPAAGKYHGADLTYCAGPISYDALNQNLTYGMACDMTGGSSGGPWLSSFSETTGSGTLSSLNSYGYGGQAKMYGPKFNTNTRAVWQAADSATSNTIVQ